jgi:hypothetical protein
VCVLGDGGSCPGPSEVCRQALANCCAVHANRTRRTHPTPLLVPRGCHGRLLRLPHNHAVAEVAGVPWLRTREGEGRVVVRGVRGVMDDGRRLPCAGGRRLPCTARSACACTSTRVCILRACTPCMQAGAAKALAPPCLPRRPHGPCMHAATHSCTQPRSHAVHPPTHSPKVHACMQPPSG